MKKLCYKNFEKFSKSILDDDSNKMTSTFSFEKATKYFNDLYQCQPKSLILLNQPGCLLLIKNSTLLNSGK